MHCNKIKWNYSRKQVSYFLAVLDVYTYSDTNNYSISKSIDSVGKIWDFISGVTLISPEEIEGELCLESATNTDGVSPHHSFHLLYKSSYSIVLIKLLLMSVY